MQNTLRLHSKALKETASSIKLHMQQLHFQNYYTTMTKKMKLLVHLLYVFPLIVVCHRDGFAVRFQLSLRHLQIHTFQ